MIKTAYAGLFLGMIHKKFLSISDNASININESLEIRVFNALFCKDEIIRFESN